MDDLVEPTPRRVWFRRQYKENLRIITQSEQNLNQSKKSRRIIIHL
jgi:hypothetical protein